MAMRMMGQSDDLVKHSHDGDRDDGDICPNSGPVAALCINHLMESPGNSVVKAESQALLSSGDVSVKTSGEACTCWISKSQDPNPYP